MRAEQYRFDFDTFDIGGFTASPRPEDPEAGRRAERERAEAQERTRQRYEQWQREQREKQERERQERFRERFSHIQRDSPWDILGVKPGASKNEVRAAWVLLSKMHHPDMGGDLAKMQRVNKAYNDLKGQLR